MRQLQTTEVAAVSGAGNMAGIMAGLMKNTLLTGGLMGNGAGGLQGNGFMAINKANVQSGIQINKKSLNFSMFSFNF